MKRILIVGNDKIGGKALRSISPNSNLICYVDRSTNIRRLFILLKRGVLSFSTAIKMFQAELFRVGLKPSKSFGSIKSNSDLLEIIHIHKPDELILFRAGLIVNNSVLSTGVKILNIHCSRLPDYGGIGTIARALKDKEYSQTATMHVVTRKIDKGLVLCTVPYELLPCMTYSFNENLAYDAGINLLLNYLIH